MSDSLVANYIPARLKKCQLFWKCCAEFIGTFFIVVIGVGVVCSSVLAESMQGLWQLTSVWGFGVGLAIYATASISGGHLNPAVTLALAIHRPNQFHWRELPFYWLAQLLGGIFGGFTNLLAFYDYIHKFEQVKKISRGAPGSELSAMAFGEYFPNPGITVYKQDPNDLSLAVDTTMVPSYYAFFIEAWGTAILMFMILALTDSRQKAVHRSFAPFLIGFTVAVLMSLYAPLTQGGFNPARDFGPRLVAAMCGWGKIALPGSRNGFWVYIFGPLFGAPIGALAYDLLIYEGLNFCISPEVLKQVSVRNCGDDSAHATPNATQDQLCRACKCQLPPFVQDTRDEC